MPIEIKHSTTTQEERRYSCPSKHAMWAQLSVTQQSAVSSMYNYGYNLAFIRTESEQQSVVMQLNEAVVLIDGDGNIDTQPNIDKRCE